MFSSIKARLIALFLFVLLVVYSALAVFLYYNLKNIAITSIDEHLHAEMELMAGLLRGGNDGLNLEEFAEFTIGAYAKPLSGHYFQVTDDKGKVLVSSPSLFIVGAKLPFSHAGTEPVFSTTVGPDRKPHRMIEKAFVVEDKIYVVQASDTLEDAYALLSVFKKNIAVVFAAVFILSAVCVFFVANLALKKLGLFSAGIERITERNLSQRLDALSLPEELKPLAVSFNTMLSRLERSFGSQREFLSDASHELRTPIAVIRSQCEVTLLKERSREEYAESLREITAATARAASLIDRILEAARFSPGMFTLDVKAVALRPILEDAVKVAGLRARSNNVSIALDCGEYLISCDRERLLDAITNIVVNGVKYNKPGGAVNISVFDEDSNIAVIISDTGMGIREEDMQKIFDRFYRSAEARGRAEGTGLGLPIAKSIIEAHGGSITAGGKYGEGAEFIIRLSKL